MMTTGHLKNNGGVRAHSASKMFAKHGITTFWSGYPDLKRFARFPDGVWCPYDFVERAIEINENNTH